MSVQELTTETEFNEITGRAVVLFTAIWCGPCKKFKPIFDSLSGEYPGVNFYKLDVDELSETAHSLGISGIPTLVFLKDRVEVNRIIGAKDLSAIKDALQTLKTEI